MTQAYVDKNSGQRAKPPAKEIRVPDTGAN
jgi:hypothetical protein